MIEINLIDDAFAQVLVGNERSAYGRVRWYELFGSQWRRRSGAES